MKRNIKIGFLIILGYLCFSLCGCGRNGIEASVGQQNGDPKALENVDLFGTGIEQQENIVGNTSLNIFNCGFAASQGNKVYYKKDWKLCSSDLDGKNEKELTSCHFCYPNINVVGDWVYFFNETGSYDDNTREFGIYKIKTDGSSETKVLTLDIWYPSFTVYDDMIYFLDEDGLYRVNVNGENMQNLVQLEQNGVNVSERRVYLIDNGQKILFYYDMGKDDDLGYYTVNIDGTDLKSIRDEFPSFDWDNLGSVDAFFPINDTCFSVMKGNDICFMDRKGEKKQTLVWDSYMQFNSYGEYYFFNDSIFNSIIIADKKGRWQEIIDLNLEYGVDDMWDGICIAGDNLFIYTESDDMSGQIVLRKNELEDYIKLFEEKQEKSDS